MLKKFFVSKLDKYKMDNALLKFVVIAIGISSICSTCVSLYAVKYTKVIIKPTSIDTDIKLRGSMFNQEYLSAMAQYLTFLRYNYTKRTINKQLEEFEKHCSPNFYNSFKEKKALLSQRVGKFDILSRLIITKISINEKEIHIIGVLYEKTSIQKNDTGKNVNIFITYKINYGQFLIDNLEEIYNIQELQQRQYKQQKG